MKQLRILFSVFPVSKQKIHLWLFYVLIAIMALPIRLAEKIVFGKRVSRQPVDPAPVFIIGHWRSGTTFLHQLMIADKRFGYVNFYQALFPGTFLLTERVFKPVLNFLSTVFSWKIPYFNNIPMDFDFPCEEDTALVNDGSCASSYWAYALPKQARKIFNDTMFFQDDRGQQEKYFRQDYFNYIRKISFYHNGKPLLLKSPPNTARLKLLCKMFPHARFIFINRDPIDLFYSHVKLWKSNMQHFSLEKIEENEIERLVTDTMKRMFEAYNNEKSSVPQGQICEINYETLIEDPLLTVSGIYDQFGIEGFNEVEEMIRIRLKKMGNYKPFWYSKDARKMEWIRKELSDLAKKPVDEATANMID